MYDFDIGGGADEGTNVDFGWVGQPGGAQSFSVNVVEARGVLVD